MMRSHTCASTSDGDPEALEWAERLPVQDYEELIGGRPGAG